MQNLRESALQVFLSTLKQVPLLKRVIERILSSSKSIVVHLIVPASYKSRNFLGFASNTRNSMPSTKLFEIQWNTDRTFMCFWYKNTRPLQIYGIWQQFFSKWRNFKNSKKGGANRQTDKHSPLYVLICWCRPEHVWRQINIIINLFMERVIIFYWLFPFFSLQQRYKKPFFFL